MNKFICFAIIQLFEIRAYKLGLLFPSFSEESKETLLAGK